MSGGYQQNKGITMGTYCEKIAENRYKTSPPSIIIFTIPSGQLTNNKISQHINGGLEFETKQSAI